MIEKKLSDQDRQDVKTYLDNIGPRLTPPMRASFVTICETFALNPFLREIYGNIVQDWQGKDQFSIIVGYEVYLKRAERTTLLDGWEKGCEGSVKDGNLKSWIKVYRKDWSRPFFHEVYYEEYVQMTKAGKPNFIWGTKPRTMIQKVAIAQAFRMAFPEHFGGMPYTSDEMPDNLTKGVPTESDEKEDEKKHPKEKKPAEQKPEAEKPVEHKPVEKTVEPAKGPEPIDLKKVMAEIDALNTDGVFDRFMAAKKWLKEGQTVDNLTEDQLITLGNNWNTMEAYLDVWKTEHKTEKHPQKADSVLPESEKKEPEPQTSTNIIDDVLEGGAA